MADDAPTDEEYAKWHTPAQALKLVTTVINDARAAKTSLVGRLRGGMIQSAGRGVAVETIGSRTTSSQSIRFITKEAWALYDTVTHGQHFWLTGEYEISPANTPPKTMIFYGVRLDLEGVRALMLDLLGENHSFPVAPEAPKQPRPEEDEPEQKGPPVSMALLKQWHELYVRAYGGTTQDTLRNAWESAKGMFPGKSVARSKVRELCGGRTRGKKPLPKSE